jgi:uncharacterized protein YehS (DUF1456 family)
VVILKLLNHSFAKQRKLYMECGDQVLRNFLNALVIPLAGKENQKIK